MKSPAPFQQGLLAVDHARSARDGCLRRVEAVGQIHETRQDYNDCGEVASPSFFDVIDLNKLRQQMSLTFLSSSNR